jgi:hypothetical protein
VDEKEGVRVGMSGGFVGCIAVLLAAVLVVPAGAGAAASDPAVEVAVTGLDGLFFTTGGKTLRSGTAVVGGAFLFASYPDATVSSLPLTITGGFSDRVELALSWPMFSRVDPEASPADTGVGDLDLRGKWSMQGETASLPAMALFAHLKLPVAQAPQGTEKTDLGIGLAADKDLGGVMGLLNVEYEAVGDRASGNQLNWALGVRIPYTDAVSFSVELLDQYSIASTNIRGDLLAGGLLVRLPPAITLGFHLGLGLDETGPDYLLGAQFSFTL